VETTTAQLGEHKDNGMMLNNEIETFRNLMKKKDRMNEELEECLKDYEERIDELKLELHEKDEIIDHYKEQDK
jgi:peptidoglycan hydrolase CwlO-like protein